MLLLSFIACKPTPPASTATPPPPPPTADTAPEFMPIGVLTMSAQFGYDAATGTAQAVSIDGQTIPPSFDLLLGPPGWQGNTSTGEHCTVSYDLTGLPVTTPAEGLLTVTAAADTPTYTSCDGLDPEEWGEDVSEFFRPMVFGATVLASLDSEVQTWLSDAGVDLDEFAGGVLHATELVGEDVTFAYTNVYETDAELTLTVNSEDRLVPVDTATIATTPVAWYTVSSGNLWTFE